MLVALVTLGAAACSEKDENVDTKQEATVSFYAEFADDTRATLDKEGDVWKTTFEEGDKLYVGTTGNDPFEFTYEDGKFVCNAEGVQTIIGTEVTINGYFGNSTTGKNAVKIVEKIEDNFQSGKKVTLESELSFFMFNYTGELTLTANENIFKKENNVPATEITLTAEGETFVAFYPTGNNTTISYSIEDVTCKTTTINFAAGKVYNLGTLKAPAKVWLLGDWNEWSAPLYMFEENGYYVAKNVEIGEGQKFKFNDGTLYFGGDSTVGTWNNFNGSDIALEAGTYNIYVSKINGAWCAVETGSSIPTLDKRYLYLKPGVWDQASAKFQAWCMGTGNNVNIDFNWICYENSANYYVLDISAGYTSFYIKRLSSDGGSTWNEVGPVTIEDNSLVTITDWSAYTLGSLIP